MKRTTTKDLKQTGGSSKRHQSDSEGRQYIRSGVAAESHVSSTMGTIGKHQRERACRRIRKPTPWANISPIGSTTTRRRAVSRRRSNNIGSLRTI